MDQETLQVPGMSLVPARHNRTKLAPIPREDALPSQHPTHLPEIIFSPLHKCLERVTRAWSGLGFVGLWGNTGAGIRVEVETTGLEFRASKEDQRH